MERARLKKRIEGGGNYFSTPSKLAFISTGCRTFDRALGGGWACDRIINIVGDKSTGKTLLCIEAAANFAKKYPKGKIRYREAESAFDKPYAEALGFPVDRVDFGQPIETVEDLFEDLLKVLDKAKGPELYILDSLDALTDRAELGRDLDEATYGAGKAKQMSQMFRRLVRKLADKGVTLIVVSQIRDKIGAMFGRKVTRTGGKALDFYASQVVYLAQIGTEKRTIGGIERVTALKIKAKVDKNKVSLAFREAEFNVHFGYGIDDAGSCVNWLKAGGFLKDIDLPKDKVKAYINEMFNMSPAEYATEIADLHKAVDKRWFEVEQRFLPTRKKYG